jgi:beta-lactamase regulating signal transducer with metallopeptidase domain
MLFRIAGSGSQCGERMLMVEGLATPCMWGVIRPCILMPVAAKEWSQAQWQAAVAHEQQHIRQHDGFHRVVAALARCVFWWNPLVHALCRRLEIESELCCDEAATVSSSRRDYGEMLLNLAVASSFETVPAWASGSGVRERIQRLIAPTPCGRASAWGRALMVAGVVLTGLVAGCCIDGVKPPVSGYDLSQEASLRLSAEAFPLR